jgi:hypothetical protein
MPYQPSKTQKKGQPMKTPHNSDASPARINAPDVNIVGNPDSFNLLFKASSESEGWMKSTKAMQIQGAGSLVQVSTQQRNPDGSYSLAEALAFVPYASITTDINNGRKLICNLST